MNKLLALASLLVAAVSIAKADGDINMGALMPTEDWTITQGSHGEGVVTIVNNGNYRVTGSSWSSRLEVGRGVTATITLDNAHISTSGGAALGLSPYESHVTLRLVGANELLCTYEGNVSATEGNVYAGLRATGTAYLTIDGTDGGSLHAQGGTGGAGIGSGAVHIEPITLWGGRITINGGVISAQGGEGSAGIGGGAYTTTDTIIINGGTIVTTGGFNGAGIGAGVEGSSGIITITDGNITATGGICGAGIGAGASQKGGMNGGNISISGGNVQAMGGTNGAGIGGGIYNDGGTITITGGQVSSISGDGAAGIGGGGWSQSAGDIRISGGTIMATATYIRYGMGAGIGSGTASGGDGTVSISGGIVYATHIGCGENSLSGVPIEITGGTVVAAAIGKGTPGGSGAASSPTTVTGQKTIVLSPSINTNVFSDATALTYGDVEVNILPDDASNYDVVLHADLTVPNYMTLEIPEGILWDGNWTTLILSPYAELDGASAERIHNINVVRAPAPDPSVTIDSTWLDPIPTQIYSGVPLTPEVTLRKERTTLVSDTDYVVSYSNNVEPGVGRVTITGRNDYGGSIVGTFAIVASKLYIDSVEVGTLLAEGEEERAWGVSDDVVTLTADRKYVISGASNRYRIAVPRERTVDLVLRNVRLVSAEGSPLTLRGSDGVGAKATVRLEGNNQLVTTESSSAGLTVEEYAELTIEGPDTLVSRGSGLHVRGNNNIHGGAGIGSGDNPESDYKRPGTIIINGGTVVASGGSGGAGIGGGCAVPGRSITINGGNISATGGYGAAGIGGGFGGYGRNAGHGGAISIYGGVVVAESGCGSGEPAGIGGGGDDGINGGLRGSASDIRIYGGYITAISSGINGAGIGGALGATASSSIIRISGGVVYADGVGIGGAETDDNVSISDSAMVLAGGVRNVTSHLTTPPIILVDGGSITFSNIYDALRIDTPFTIPKGMEMFVPAQLGTFDANHQVIRVEGTLTWDNLRRMINRENVAYIDQYSPDYTDTIRAGWITLQEQECVYSGDSLYPTITGVRDAATNRTLRRNIDYQIQGYARNLNVGTGTVTVIGIGDYKGTVVVPFTILPCPLSILVNATANEASYNGGYSTWPVIALRHGTRLLLEAVDFRVTPSDEYNYTKVGNAMVFVEGIGNYTGSLSILYNIVTAQSLSTSWVHFTEPIVYTGDSLRPAWLYDGVDTLVAGVDYTVAYTNNVNAGTASVVFTAISGGDYIGSATVPFVITPKHLPADNIAPIPSQTYTADSITPVLVVKDGDKTLTLDSGDYAVVSWQNNIKVGTATVTIEGRGNYTGTVTQSFNIVPPPAGVVALQSHWIYNLPSTVVYSAGGPIVPDITLQNAAETLTADEDYTLRCVNNTGVGRATITLTGIGDYWGELTDSFEITAKSMMSPDIVVTCVDSDYNVPQGTWPKFENFLVKDNGHLLRWGVDYSINNLQRIGAGQISIHMEGRGNYEGEMTYFFSDTASVVSSEEPAEPEEPGDSILPAPGDSTTETPDDSIPDDGPAEPNEPSDSIPATPDEPDVPNEPDEPSSTASAAPGELRVSGQGDGIKIAGLQAGQSFVIYTVKGEKYLSATADAAGEYRAAKVAEGLYIIIEQSGRRSKFYRRR